MVTIRTNLIPADAVRARFGDVSESTLYRWVKRGEIPRPIKIGRARFFDSREIEDHIAALKARRA